MTRLHDFDYCTQLTAEHPILTDHRVHGERILPGVTFIDMIMQVLVSEKIALESIQLERMLFRTPICLAEGQSCDLRVRYVANEARIYVETRLHNDWIEHCRAQLSLTSFPELPAYDVQALKAQAKTQNNLNIVYEKAKRLSINHGPYMQGEGVAYVGDDYVLAEIQLSEKAKASAADHIVHPALMDSATVVPFAAGINGMDSDNPFIPIAIENVNLRAPINSKVLVLAKISADGKADSDVLHNDILLLNETGEVVGRFLRLTAKCIRTAEAITGLQTPIEKSLAPSAIIESENKPASMLTWLTQVVAQKLGQSEKNLNIHQGFYELGLDSSALLDLVAQFEQQLGCTLYPTLLFEHNTIHALADYFASANILIPQADTTTTKAVIAQPKTLFIKQSPALEQSSKNHSLSLLDFITTIIQETLANNSQPDIHTGFYELGLDSNQLLSISNRLEKEFNTSLYPTLLFEYNTIQLLAAYFEEQQLQPANNQVLSVTPENIIEPEIEAIDYSDLQGDVFVWQSAWQEKNLDIQSSPTKNWLVVGDERNSKAVDYLLQTKSKLYYFKDEVDEDYPELAQSFAEQVESCVSDKNFGGVIWLVPGREHQQHLQMAVIIAQALAKTGKQLAIYALVHERNIAATALAGFWRSLRHELSRLQVRQIMSQSLAAYEWLAEFSAAPQGVEIVRYHHGQREIEQFEQVDINIYTQPSTQAPSPKGAILISGGFGGIAMHLVEHLIARGWQQFALLGRKLPDEKIAQQLEQWRTRGVEILAISADVSNKSDITKAWRKIKNRFAQVSGIVHSAGVLRDGLVKDKTATQLQEVLAAKVTGANLLDKLSAQEKLDFFVCFGSISGVLGNLGQSDYAYANAALAVFMAERQQLVDRKERSGRSLTIHWPLWRAGGMALSPERSNQLASLTGLQQIETAQALAAFDALLDSNNFPQAAYLPVIGNMDRFSAHLQQLGLFTPKAVQVVEAPKSQPDVVTEPNPAPLVREEDEAIAIIGLAGVYPAANSINSFWNNLTAGVDAITEIPASRWDNAALFDDARGTPGKIYSRWGGFIEQADQFDAEFFGVTPKEAELMDPQERLFLQVAWHTLEDAGLPVSGLTKSAVGVFVGAMWAQYQLLGLTDSSAKQTASMFSAIANRVSYTLNLTGPSLAIDTMCSSSLSALHLAVESIRRGDCSMALVGGVNVMSHAHKYQFLCQNQMLSDDGKCRSFGEGGSGYVPGEGVGAVLLKPLAQAERDGDNIHGIIRGSALNHGGRAAGMTVPNPGAQAKVIQAALADAGLEADRVSVIEAHGTGTLLGDPIELIGLKKVFGQNKLPVSIGSVKSNIGHLESAAGIAALSKVILQLKHKQLIPSLHSQTLNAKLPLQDSPFVVQQSLAPWQSSHARVAGISAFGAGGSNAHVLVQEYESKVADVFHAQLVIPISARNTAALDRYVEQWLTYLTNGHALAPQARLADIAWSAQTGRDAMAERLALVCNSREEAIDQLKAFRNRQPVTGLFTPDATINPVSEQEKLAAAFVAGDSLNWPAFGGVRVSIPTYPFAPMAYWYARELAEPVDIARKTSDHPLLHRVIPSLEGARFATQLSQQDLLVAEHNINGRTLVPAAAMLTMMVDGAAELGLQLPLSLTQMTIARPLDVVDAVDLRTCFYPADTDSKGLLAEVLSVGSVPSGEKIHAQARLTSATNTDISTAQLPDTLADATELYRQFSACGFAYGPAFQQISSYARTGESEVWARLKDNTGRDTVTQTVLVLDAALQASVLLQGDITQDEQAFLPYQLADISYFGELAQAAWIQVTSLPASANERAFALAIFAEDGTRLWECSRFTLRAAAGVSVAAPAPVAVIDQGEALAERIASHISHLLATHTGLDKQVIAKAASFDQVGIDSIVIMNVTRELETIAGQLPKTLFFECPSVASLAAYLGAEHKAAFAQALGVQRVIHKPAALPISAGAQPVPQLQSFAKNYRAASSSNEPLAIVGVAGRYPDADNLDQLWDNLKNGRDSVIPVPAHRWDIEQYYHPDKTHKHTTYCRHGGFVDKAEYFDPAFFNMTPADAILADPQERIFLQTAWHALEDAGYARRHISGKSVGVFAAVMWNQYQMYGLNKAMAGEAAGAYSVASALANRVSYTMNIKGPSLTLDTMCSSSLTALHLAARAIWNGDCEAAFVGGVNLSLHPHKYVSLCTSNFLSANGRCSAFGENADGYVPAEAVGVVYIKPLAQAEADGDHIYGVIRATAINHVGTTNGATVPSPDSQADLIRQACNLANIAPQSINYIEAHGTGTSLGDPIEVRGLDKALNAGQQHSGCVIGSIKSNIGHPESAAGIASLTKVLLQLKHGQLVPSLHASPANPHIDFASSTISVNQTLRDWPRLNETAPRRAGIHSFGAGGSNAHVIVEEYQDRRSASPVLDSNLLVVSARGLEQLKAGAARLLDWLAANPDASLTEFCYTLQLGREAFDHRFAAPVASLADCVRSLQALADGNPDQAGVYHRLTANDDLASMLANNEGKTYIDTLLANQRWDGLSRFWVHGVELNWASCYAGGVRRLSLPGYAFAEEKLLRPLDEAEILASQVVATQRIHLQNRSDLYGQRFRSELHPRHAFLSHHQIEGRKLVPMAWFASLALAAAQQSAGDEHWEIAEFALTQPLIVGDESLVLDLLVEPGAANGLHITLLQLKGDGEQDIASVKLQPRSSIVELSTAELASLPAQDSNDFYAQFAAAGFNYGPQFRQVARFAASDSKLVGELGQATSAWDDVVHPGVIDAALQLTRELTAQDGRQWLPQAMRGFWFDALSQPVTVVVERVQDRGEQLEFRLYWCDAAQSIVGCCSSFTLAQTRATADRLADSLLIERRWLAREFAPQADLGDTPLWIIEPNNHWLKNADAAQAISIHWSDTNLIEQPTHWLATPDAEGMAALANRLPKNSTGLRILLGDTSDLAYNQTAFWCLWNLVRELVGRNLNRLELVLASKSPAPEIEALHSWMHALAEERPGFQMRLVQSSNAHTYGDWLGALVQDAKYSRFNTEGHFEVYGIGEHLAADEPALNLAGKTILITGGAGGLGRVFACHLAQTHSCNLVLTGRKPADDQIKALVAELRGFNVEVAYYAATIGDQASMDSLSRKIAQRFGGLDGVVHAAGVSNDQYILRQDREQMAQVLVPKVQGTVQLLAALAELGSTEASTGARPWMVGFSSISGFLGNAGQADYSFANAAMDSQLQQASDIRCLSINWPLWDGVGMQLNQDIVSMMRKATGMSPLPVALGLQLFDRALAGTATQLLPLYGERTRMHGWISSLAQGLAPLPAAVNAQPAAAAKPIAVSKPLAIQTASQITKAQAVAPVASAPVQTVAFDMRALVADAVAKETGIKAEAIDWEKSIDQYGFSSVVVTALTVSLQKTLGDLPKTLFFECRTLAELAAYLLQHHAPATSTAMAVAAPVAPAATPAIDAVTVAKRDYRLGRARDEISIVGAAGRFPQAENLQAFWQNLVEGRDCVTAPPADRWTTGDAIPAYAKGGFIADVDKFDANFFGISRAEATAIDPQERLFLQTAWHSLEDAGIAPASLAGRKVGVYVGAMWGQYQLQGLDAWRNGTGGATISSFASIANRVSYAFDFKGPSVAMDSMCSSSLVALKIAIDALNNGEIDYALVGGVNTSLHAYKYKQLQDSMFLSKAGCCKAFGSDGDGYVPGEGVVCMVLTRSSDAVQQGIRERARIKGMAVAHGGSGNGYYVPNPHEQAEVIRQALANARIAPETISYVEAHGTGTALGDPIEVRGLEKSYFAQSKFPCAIGSVKANLGHLESAAGMASICKVLLQMEHDQLVPSIHSTPQNPAIDFAATGLQVQRELASWSAFAGERPRRAGISSFGAGGTNVHLILEAVTAPVVIADKTQAGLFVLSAKDLAGLKRLAETTHAWLPSSQANIAELANTSQRRQAFDYRLAFVVDSRDALHKALSDWLAEPQAHKVHASTNSHIVVASAKPAELQQLATAWLAGDALVSNLPVRADLPLYPFARERYWLDVSRAPVAQVTANQAPAVAPTRLAVKPAPVANDLAEQVVAMVAQQLGYDLDDIDVDADFNRLGLDSVQASELATRLTKLLNAEVLPTAFYNYPNLDSFSRQLAAQYQPQAETSGEQEFIPAQPLVDRSGEPIAIIGMSGAFAQAENLAEFWDNLKAGKDCVAEVPEERWSLKDHYNPTPGAAGKTYSRRMGLMKAIGDFDPTFFGLLPEEAMAMEPQQRLFLKHSYLALEDAGIRREQLDGSKTGIFAGAMSNNYRQLLPHAEAFSALAMIGNHNAALPARLAYWLNLKGPSLVVDTACSSSLMALHLACNSLLAGESNMALAGGVFITPGAEEQIASSAAGMLSAEGQCKTFADDANGIAIGEGVGVVVLKTLAQAQADGDPIYAVIRATGANQDGKTNGITAPNALSQGELVRAVMSKAKLTAADVQYIETHGTGTKLGDPVEIEGLKIALGDAPQEILLGSVKPNIGHCYAAAGVASLMKAVLAIKTGEIPPSIHAESLNSLIPFAKLPFAVNRTLRLWPTSQVRRAGVSAFGYTGTNVHVVLEHAPRAASNRAHTNLPLLLPISARKAGSLCLQAQKLAHYLEQNPVTDMGAFAYTLQLGRSALEYRQCLLVGDRDEAITKLRALANADVKTLPRIKRKSEQPASSLGENCIVNRDWAGLIAHWQNGMALDWAQHYSGQFQRLNLPGSEFDNKTYWPEKAAASAPAEQTIAVIQQAVAPLSLKLKAISRTEFKNIA